MKAHLSLMAAAVVALSFMPGAARAQGASAVIDEALINATNTNHSQIMAILERQLTEAERQSQRLQEQLSRMGDPRTVNVAAREMMAADLAKAETALKTESEQRAALSAITGREVFDNDAFGVLPAIGATVTKTDGSVVERDAARYKMEAVMDAGVQEYKTVREAAIERKKEILKALGEINDQVAAAEDLATVAKLQAMIVLLEGRLADCNKTIELARGDAEMMEKELTNQARIVTKGQQEAQVLESAPDPDATPTTPAEAIQSFKNSLSVPGGRLPWAKKAGGGVP